MKVSFRKLDGLTASKLPLRQSPDQLFGMSTVAEIETAIERLSPEEQRELRDWLLERLPADDNDDVLVPPAYRQKVLDAIDQP